MREKMIDMTGKRYGRLVAIEFLHKTDKREYFWLFQCDCGNQKKINGNSVRKGVTKSCGCLSKETVRNRCRTHGMSKTNIYHVWNNMMGRCFNKNDPSYKNYGARGITVSERWLVFENFLEDMGHPPDSLSIDRIDNESGYSKENCRWTDISTQNTNKRPWKESSTGIRNISFSERDGLYEVGIKRHGKRYRKHFKELKDAIQWKEEMLKTLSDVKFND